jgi:hypothetical protein
MGEVMKANMHNIIMERSSGIFGNLSRGEGWGKDLQYSARVLEMAMLENIFLT